MFVSKLMFAVKLPVNGPDLRKAFEEAGVPLTEENFFRARHELKYLLDRKMNDLLKEVAERVRDWSVVK